MLAASTLPGQPAAITLHIALGGNDAWTGESASATTGGNGPLASIAGARDRLRSLRVAGPLAGGARVIVHAGTYRVQAPIEFGTQDSGADESSPVIFEGAPGEDRPIISGGREITGWSRDGELWKATLPDDFAGTDKSAVFSGLWMGGERRTRARTPNEGFLYMADALPGAKRAFRYFGDDLRPEWAYDETTGTGAVISVYHTWEVSLHHLATVRDPTNSAVMTAPLEKAWATFQPSMRYRVENVREALDAPGEWFLDRATHAVLYMPLPNEPSPEGRVIAPVAEALLRITGTPDRPVQHLTFQGLGFEHTDWELPPEGVNDGTAAITLPAAIETRWSRNLVFADCRMAHLGGYALSLDEGTSHCTVQQCELTDLGGGGIKIGRPAAASEASDRATGQNTVDNCFIHDGGITRPSAVGIWIGRSAGNTVSRNEICDFAYEGIFVGWNWGYGPTRTTDTTITGNEVHHIGQGLLSDLGAIYLVGEQPGAEVSYNFVHDVNALEKGYGLYADEGCSYAEFHHNIIANTIGGSVMVHYGRSISFRNNIFAFSHSNQINYPGGPGKPSQIDVSRNIFYFNNGLLLGPSWEDWHDNSLNQLLMDDNLYRDASGREIRFGPLRLPGWRAAGFDTRGRVADPMFFDPESYDFRLRPGSPALDMGFEPIDTSRIGLYGDPAWVALPKSVKHPAFPLASPISPSIHDGFESTRIGMRAADAVTIGESPADGISIRVGDQHAEQGSHALEFHMAERWHSPTRAFAAWRLRLPPGPVEAGFAVRISSGAAESGSPVFMYDWSDRETGPIEGRGPALRIMADGTLIAGGKRLSRLPFNTWIIFAVNGPAGGDSPPIYTISARPAGQAARQWKVSSGPLVRLEEVSFASPPKSGVSFSIDNVRIEPGSQ